MTVTSTILTILTIAAVTFLTRLLPFLIFPANKKTPPFVTYLGRVLPYTIIGMLIVYCFKNINPFKWPCGMPELLASVFVITAHKWKHNLLLSIGGGTILYMFLVQVIFL